MSVELQNISKTFSVKKHQIKALDSINLKIHPGEFVGLLGPNGAGKTTLTKILATLVIPDEGEGFIDSVPLSNYKQIRYKVSVVFGESGGRSLYYRLSVKDNLLFYATLAGVPKKQALERINVLLEYFDLQDKAKALTMKLSTGMKAKVLLIRALIPNTPILLLDEPTLGFDAISAEKAKDLLLEFNKQFDTTILLTSHNFSEIDELTKRLILIDKGKIVQDCSPYEFKKVASKQAIEVIFKLPTFIEDVFEEELRVRTGATIGKVQRLDGQTIKLTVVPELLGIERTISLLTIYLIEIGADIVQINPHFPSLKESFLAFLETKEIAKAKLDTSEVLAHLE